MRDEQKLPPLTFLLYLVILSLGRYLFGCFSFEVPKSSEGHVETPQEVLGSMKQVSYKTEIIGGVPIITATQVPHTHTHSHGPFIRSCNSSAGLVLSDVVCSHGHVT